MAISVGSPLGAASRTFQRCRRPLAACDHLSNTWRSIFNVDDLSTTDNQKGTIDNFRGQVIVHSLSEFGAVLCLCSKLVMYTAIGGNDSRTYDGGAGTLE